MGKVSFEDAEGNIYRNSLTSSIGEAHIKRMDVTDHPLRILSGDRIVLMSDGIYRGITETEMIPFMEKSPSETADDIISFVLNKKEKDQDNMSILVIEKK